MAARRGRMPRKYPNTAEAVEIGGASPTRYMLPRLVRLTLIDFGSLGLPEDVRRALAEAFWCHFGVRAERCLHTCWFHIKTFDRFARESGVISSLADVHGDMLVRYVEWLNTQCRADGRPWTKSSRASAYSMLRKLLQWIERCRPGAVARIEYPFNPFPWRNRDVQSRSKMPPGELRALLRACEADIAQIRVCREAVAAQRIAGAGKPGTLGWLLEYIDRRLNGFVSIVRELPRPVRMVWHRFGGAKQVEPCLYPRGELLFPYYIAIMIHAAGNPEPIAELSRDCLQSLPLLDDRQALVWFKARANSFQRRTFSTTDRFEPPALVKEILDWNERLRPLAPAATRDGCYCTRGRAEWQHSRLALLKG